MVSITARQRDESERNAGATIAPKVVAARFTSGDFDKMRGGYYTPIVLANWLSAWAIRSRDEHVLEPSCGDGTFIDAATTRLMELGATRAQAVAQARGVELVPTEAEKARTRLRGNLGVAGNDVVVTSDFFTWNLDAGADEYFDVIVGNPPFLRYQSFPEPSRTLAMDLLVTEGLKANKLTNIWVPFVVAAASKLAPGGRMALVLPAELLQVSYAAQLRSFLIDRFERIEVVACNELFFEKAEQEVVLLLAEGRRPAGSLAPASIALVEAETVTDVTGQTPLQLLRGAEAKPVADRAEKWLKYFLSATEIDFMRTLRESAAVTSLKTHGSIDVGVVTGKNEFFVLTAEQVETWGLEKHVVPLASRAAHLKGALFDSDEWGRLSEANQRVYLLVITAANEANLSAQVRRYIAAGQAQGFDQGYKCSIRKPWYGVPSVWTPDGFFFRQIYDFPRVVANRAGATATDTIHRLKAERPDALMGNIYTHLSGASAEIEGRSYGGGVLELEPTEAERLLVPTELAESLPLEEVDRLVRAGRLADALSENDGLILRPLGLSKADCQRLKDIWVKMRDRRMGRRKRVFEG
jgi:adenine-specific DNA-methyltransferase